MPICTTPQDEMLEAASFAPEDAFCGDPACAGFSSVDDLSECDCGNQVCQDCRTECDCCGEYIGCVNCLVRDSEGELVCDGCLKKCDCCSYSAGYKRMVKCGDVFKCENCNREGQEMSLGSTLIDQVKYVNGFQGVKCHSCGATHNVCVDIPGIICEKCGKHIVLAWSHHQITFRHPDFGFKRSVINWALRNHGHYKDMLN